MPINPVTVENRYALPPLQPEQPDEFHTMEYVPPAPAGVMFPGQSEEDRIRTLGIMANAVPMSEWKPAPERLPLSQKELARQAMDFGQMQLAALQKAAADPDNPMTQAQVDKLREQINQGIFRSIREATTPSVVSMHETMVNEESPEIAQANYKDSLLTLPGYKPEWNNGIRFNNETGEPIYPPGLEKTVEALYMRAAGIPDPDEQKAKAKSREDNYKYLSSRHQDKKPDQDQYDDPDQYTADLDAWRAEDRRIYEYGHPGAGEELDAFLGAAQPEPGPARTNSGVSGSWEVAPQTVGPDEVAIAQLRAKLGTERTPTVVANTRQDVVKLLSSGEITPDTVIIMSGPQGTIGYKLGENGKFRPVARQERRL